MTKPEVIYRPGSPHPLPRGALLDVCYYRVMHGDETWAAYHSAYYRGVESVAADLLRVIGRLWHGPLHDLVIRRGGRTVGLIGVGDRRSGLAQHRVVLLSNEDLPPARPEPGWPTYEEWVAGGRGPLPAPSRVP